MPKSLQFSHWQAVLFNGFFLTLTTGIFLNDYLLRIGFTQFDFGILYSGMYFTGMIAFPVSFYANSIRRRKAFFLSFHFIFLFFFLLFVAVPYVFEPGSRIAVWMTILFVGLYSITLRIGQIVIIPWMYDLVGKQKWVRFFLIRLHISYIVPVFVTFCFGRLMKFEGIPVLSLMFLIAFVMGLLGVICMTLFPENAQQPKLATNRESLSDIFRKMFKHRVMTGILLYSMLLSFGFGLFVPAVYPFLINKMGIANTTVSLFQVVTLLSSLASIFIASKICERKGSITALFWLSSIMWTVPFLLLVLPAFKYVISALLYFLGVDTGYGFIFAGVFVALTNVSLQNLPQENHIVSLAFIELTKSLFMGLGSFACGWTVKHASGTGLGFFKIGGYQILFLLSFVCVLAAFFVTIQMKKTTQNAQSVKSYETMEEPYVRT